MDEAVQQSLYPAGIYQHFLPGCAELSDLVFAFQRTGSIGTVFLIDKDHRPAAARISGSLETVIVLE